MAPRTAKTQGQQASVCSFQTGMLDFGRNAEHKQLIGFVPSKNYFSAQIRRLLGSFIAMKLSM